MSTSIHIYEHHSPCSTMIEGQMSGRDALPALARDNKDEQPWKLLDDEEAARLMAKLAAHKLEQSDVKTGDKVVARDIERSLNRLNDEVSDNVR